MMTIRIIPCLDVDEGRVVKGIKFSELRDAGDPVALARRYQEQNADELVFLDIGASHQSRETMLSIVEQVSQQVFIPLTVGGGIRSVEEARKLLPSGIEYAGDIYETFRDADAVVLLTEWNAYRGLDLARIRKAMRGKVFIDLRNVYEPADMRKAGFES